RTTPRSKIQRGKTPEHPGCWRQTSSAPAAKTAPARYSAHPWPSQPPSDPRKENPQPNRAVKVQFTGRLHYKRLERGEFRFPRGNTPSIEITPEQLLRLLSGLEVKARPAA